jgi:hypothetical protein
MTSSGSRNVAVERGNFAVIGLMCILRITAGAARRQT